MIELIFGFNKNDEVEKSFFVQEMVEYKNESIIYV